MKYIEDLRLGLENCMKNDKKVVMLGEDIGKSYGGAFKVSKGLEEKFPCQVISTPMSESALTGIVTGMALNGWKPILEIMFGDFITLCCDQIVNHASKFKFLFDKDMSMVIRTPMGGYRGYGATHSQSIEKIFFGFPHVKIFAANILYNPSKLLKKAVYCKTPSIFIENKLDYSRELGIDTKKFNFAYNEEDEILEVSIKNENECEGYIISYGGMVSMALELIWDIFSETERVFKLLVFNVISNIDGNILKYINERSSVYVLEEGIINGGFGAELARIILCNNFKISKFEALGSRNEVIGASKALEYYILPDKNYIFKTIVGDNCV